MRASLRRPPAHPQHGPGARAERRGLRAVLRPICLLVAGAVTVAACGTVSTAPGASLTTGGHISDAQPADAGAPPADTGAPTTMAPPAPEPDTGGDGEMTGEAASTTGGGLPGDPDPGAVLFADDFETTDPTAGLTWTNVHLQTAPGQPPSTLSWVTGDARSGDRYVTATAAPGGPQRGYTCGKASLNLHGLDVGIGDVVTWTGWFRLDRTDTGVHLLDVEGPAPPGGATGDRGGSPGVRVITDRHGRLRINWKFLNWYTNNGLEPPADAPDTPPPGTHVIVPGTWFELTLRMTLDNGGRGVTEVLVNGEPDIVAHGTNIAPEGLETLDTYPKVEVGVNCNAEGSAGPVTVDVDDVTVTRLS